jgi:CRP/FNR family cyclic AMP-dependent transcriptional regulator
MDGTVGMTGGITVGTTEGIPAVMIGTTIAMTGTTDVASEIGTHGESERVRIETSLKDNTIMIQRNPKVDTFKRRLGESLHRETKNSRAVKIAQHAVVYARGDQDEQVYFIERGQIKLLMLASEGKECLLAIHATGDIFGELCLSGLDARVETAVAMQETVLKQIPCSRFFDCINRESLFEGFVQYLAVRVADQQQVIANLVTVDSEQRLGKTLLRLARTKGKRDPHSIRIELRISHEELSEMVGTTGPRIGMFMQRFHNLGLIETNADRFLVIKEVKLADYLAQLA